MENFDLFASGYKEVLDKTLGSSGEKGEYFAEYKAKYIARYYGEDFSGKVLDYGCGVGLLSRFLATHLPGASIDGYDTSSVSIEHVPADLKLKGLFCSNIDHLGSDYDLIIMANVMHHIEPDQRQAVIAKVTTFLSHNGKLFIFEHNPGNPLTRKVVRNSPLDKGVTLLAPVETISYMRKSNYKDVQKHYIVFFPRFLSALRWIEPFLSWMPLGAQYVVRGTYGKDNP